MARLFNISSWPPLWPTDFINRNTTNRRLLFTLVFLYCLNIEAFAQLQIQTIVREGKPFFLVSVPFKKGDNSMLNYRKGGETGWSQSHVRSSKVLIGPCKEGERYDFKLDKEERVFSTTSILLLKPITDKEEIANKYFHNLGEAGIIESDEEVLFVSYRELSFQGYTYFELRDRHENLVQSFALKNLGKMQYFGLPIMNLALRTGERYIFKGTGASGNPGELKIKRIDKDHLDDLLAVNIKPLPIVVGCEAEGNNLIDFVAEMDKEGTAPYEIRWVVFEGQSQYTYLHEPLEQKIQRLSDVTKLTVTDSPGYGVYFFVKDACGKTGEAYMYVGCREKKKKHNALFFDLNNQGGDNGSAFSGR